MYADLFSIWIFVTNFIKIIIKIKTFCFKKVHLTKSAPTSRSFCPSLNMLSSSTGRFFIHRSFDTPLCNITRYYTQHGNDKSKMSLHMLTLISSWISNYILHKMWGEITYPYPNFNGCTVEVREWISNFESHFTRPIDYLSMLGFKSIHSKRESRQELSGHIRYLALSGQLWGVFQCLKENHKKLTIIPTSLYPDSSRKELNSNCKPLYAAYAMAQYP